MKVCRNCSLEKTDREFARKRLVCYPCSYLLQGGSKHNPIYMHAYYNKHKNDLKYKAYLVKDKSLGWDTIDKVSALNLMSKACVYCGETPCSGLDRIDNAKGHSSDNVLSCCEKCNNILGDIPYEAKLLLADGLKTIKEKGFLDTWIIPTKRRKKRKS